MALRPRTEDRPIGILGDRHVGILGLSRLMHTLRRIARILRPSQQPPEKTRQLDVAAPWLELSTGHAALLSVGIDPSRTRRHANVAAAPLGHGAPGVAPLAAQLASQALGDCILDAALDVVGDEEGVDL
jgi:hypothetical protein